MRDKPYWQQRRDMKNGKTGSTDSPRAAKPADQPKSGHTHAKPGRPSKIVPAPSKGLPGKYKAKIKRTSKKRAKENRQYTPVKRKYLQDHPICEVEGCGAPSTDLHHVRGRSGKQLLKIEDFMATCRPHHDQFEKEDKAARDAGHKKSRLGKAKK